MPRTYRFAHALLHIRESNSWGMKSIARFDANICLVIELSMFSRKRCPTTESDFSTKHCLSLLGSFHFASLIPLFIKQLIVDILMCFDLPTFLIGIGIIRINIVVAFFPRERRAAIHRESLWSNDRAELYLSYMKLSSRLNGPILRERSLGKETLCFLKLSE